MEFTMNEGSIVADLSLSFNEQALTMIVTLMEVAYVLRAIAVG